MNNLPLLAAFLLMTFFAETSARADASSGTNNEYVFILGAQGNPYWKALGEGIQDAARVNQTKTAVYYLQDETGAEEQLNICLNSISRHPKLIAISSVTTSIAIQCFKAATSKGILVADIDGHLLPADAEKKDIKLLFSVGSDNYLIGQSAAKYIAEISTKVDPRILIIEGDPGHPNGQKRLKGFVDALGKVLPKAVVVASISARWDRLQAMSITSDALAREAKPDFIYAVNDGMALGALESLRVNNRPDIRIIGIDGTRDARNAVLAGGLAATVAQLPYLIGKLSMELALSPPSDPLVVTPAPVLDLNVLQAGKADFLQYLR